MISVAIDGPAGAGKSTIARAIAQKLGYIYADTGALYRAIAYYALNKNVKIKSESKILPLLDEIIVTLKFINNEQHVFINDEDVSDKIRTSEVSMAASDVSALPAVRKFLFALQQNLAKENNIVMDGRDIGTVVLPNATVKIFLTATADERAKRRWKELKEKGKDVNLADVLHDVITRDYNDEHRDISPLMQADDAVLVDTTKDTLEQAIERIINIIKDYI
ncbi:MAG: (d)CMP kinase [Hydrogenoanaerobacterium sp.]